MDKRKMALLAAGFLIMGAAFYISVPTAFMTLLIGLLIIPPTLMISAALVQGVSILSESFFRSEKEDMVISV